MRGASWYVIQVETGRERSACKAIERACRQAQAAERQHALDADEDVPATEASLLQECFAPSYQTQFKLHGAWHNEERLLLPGYVMAVTSNPWKLAHVLRGVAGLTKLLRMGETFAPLSDDDRAWIERWTTEGDRTIPMSIAYKEGDRVVVTEGPLKGHEAMITKVNRRKSLAELEIHAGQLTIRTTVGLAVLPES